MVSFNQRDGTAPEQALIGEHELDGDAELEREAGRMWTPQLLSLGIGSRADEQARGPLVRSLLLPAAWSDVACWTGVDSWPAPACSRPAAAPRDAR